MWGLVVGEVVGYLEELVGEGGVGEDAECGGSLELFGGGAVEGGEGVGYLVEGGVEADDVAGGGFEVDVGGAVFVGAAGPDAAFAGFLLDRKSVV